jgi:hypothetical protein
MDITQDLGTGLLNAVIKIAIAAVIVIVGRIV